MTHSPQPHVVLGATGGAGRALVRELLDRGRDVRAVSRQEAPDLAASAEVVAADCTDRQEALGACDGAAVVYDCLNVPYDQWPTVLPDLTENSIAAAASANAPLVLLDNLYAYGPTNKPLTESTARQPEGPKQRLRAELEDVLRSAHEAGRARIAIGRASDFYGPHANSATRDLVFEAALDRKTAAWIGSLDAPHTMSYLPDVAWGLATLGNHDDAFGEVWHLPSNEPVTGRRFIQMVYEEVGSEPKMRAYGYWSLRFAGLFDAQVREVKELLYQFEEPFVMDTTKFEEAFGENVTPYLTAIRETLNWHRTVRSS